jgi:hypothetical protein
VQDKLLFYTRLGVNLGTASESVSVQSVNLEKVLSEERATVDEVFSQIQMLADRVKNKSLDSDVAVHV